LFEVEFAMLGDVQFEKTEAEAYGGAGLEKLDELEIEGAVAYCAGLEEVVFAIVGAATYGVDVGLEKLVFAMTDIVRAAAYADVVFAGTELGAATYGVDVELEQDVFDGTAGAVTSGIALQVVFSLTELVGDATEIVAFRDVVFAGIDIVGATAHAADPSRKQRVGKTAEAETF
jgi:hypothetical protein